MLDGTQKIVIVCVIGWVLFSVFYSTNIDCSKANQNNPQLCEDGKPFLAFTFSAIPTILLLGYFLCEYPNTKRLNNEATE